MGWESALCAVQREKDVLVPIVPEKIEYEDQRWHVWFSFQTEMKKLIKESSILASSDWQLFGGAGKFHGRWMPFLNEQDSKAILEALPTEIKEFLEENIGNQYIYCYPARLKDWLDFDYDQLLWTNPEGEVFTFREFINRFDQGELFRVMAELKTKGNSADIYLLAYWF